MKKSPNPGAASSSKPARTTAQTPAKRTTAVKPAAPATAKSAATAKPGAKATAKSAATKPAAKAAIKSAATVKPKAKATAKSAATKPVAKASAGTAAAKPAAKTASQPAATTSGNNSFFQEVFRLVRQIPRGRVTSYGDIANVAEARITARMVGWAMHAAGSARPPIPAHRVVNSSGVLSGRQAFPTPTLMQELLEQEGVTVKNDKVQNFSKLRWTPPAAKGKAMPVVKQSK